MNVLQDIIKECLAPGYDINMADEHGKTALYYASMANCKNVVEFLLEKGANPNLAIDKIGSTLLHLTSYSGQENIVKVLVKFGANINIKTNSLIFT